MTSVEQCEAAMTNVDIDDNELILMFRACTDPANLVREAVRGNHNAQCGC
jgi:hypothetical protein